MRLEVYPNVPFSFTAQTPGPSKAGISSRSVDSEDRRTTVEGRWAPFSRGAAELFDPKYSSSTWP